jgi:hypothetical protein
LPLAIGKEDSFVWLYKITVKVNLAARVLLLIGNDAGNGKGWNAILGVQNELGIDGKRAIATIQIVTILRVKFLYRDFHNA